MWACIASRRLWACRLHARAAQEHTSLMPTSSPVCRFVPKKISPKDPPPSFLPIRYFPAIRTSSDIVAAAAPTAAPGLCCAHAPCSSALRLILCNQQQVRGTIKCLFPTDRGERKAGLLKRLAHERIQGMHSYTCKHCKYNIRACRQQRQCRSTFPAHTCTAAPRLSPCCNGVLNEF